MKGQQRKAITARTDGVDKTARARSITLECWTSKQCTTRIRQNYQISKNSYLKGHFNTTIDETDDFTFRRRAIQQTTY
ncbi:hypothetical protein PUN28_002235 [Cardiocondyla obscurior]|uniref:Uncharacterized protein n=1 Tax=Cardiocondyla obscurior TaxID=286306 RepID=A0AAW2GT91_9HYME